MQEYQSLNHTKWECKYHVVFIPKCRRKVLYGELRRHLGPVFRTLTEQKESRVEEGHLMPDHVHMMLSIPPKYAVAQIVGYIKGKSAIQGAAQLLFDEGFDLMETGRFAEACPKLEESQRLDPGMGTQFRLAECYEHTRRPASAWSTYVQVLQAARRAGMADREALAMARVQSLEPTLPRIQIDLAPAAARTPDSRSAATARSSGAWL